MLPINTQAQANADKFILDTLQRQGEELSKQSKNIEKLVTELNRQRRANEKLRTNSKATDSTEGPGILNTPMSDLLKMFKFESGDDFKNNFGKSPRTNDKHLQINLYACTISPHTYYDKYLKRCLNV
jgi:hypothetical protein